MSMLPSGLIVLNDRRTLVAVCVMHGQDKVADVAGQTLSNGCASKEACFVTSPSVHPVTGPEQ